MHLHLHLTSSTIPFCKVMDSKKAPLFLSLRSVDLGSPAVPLLFKSGDDLRQDQLMLQLMALTRSGAILRIKQNVEILHAILGP